MLGAVFLRHAGGFFAGFVLLYLVVIVASFFAGARILAKAGYPGWLILLALVPPVGFVMFFVFAFSRWPIEQQLDAARRSPGGGYSPPPGGYPPPAPAPPWTPPPAPGGYPPPATGYPPTPPPPPSGGMV